MKNKRIGKKGLLALDQLLGVMLSIMALIMLFMYFIVPILLYTPTNLGIAKSNAESIKNFIDYSSDGEYSRLRGCYNVLRLHNLENYQFKDEDREKNNYFYIIDAQRVYVVPFKYLGTLMEKKDMQNIASVYKTDEFENGNVNIFYDKTDQGWSVSTDVEVIPFIYDISMGRSDSHLNFDTNGDYIVLVPFVESDSFFARITNKVFSDRYSQNSFYVQVFMNNDDKDSDGKKLVFSPDDRKLFVSGGAISDLIVNNFLCSYLYLNKKDEVDFKTKKDSDSNYVNLDKVAFTKEKIKIEYIFEDGGSYGKSFLWVGKPVCLDKDNIISCSFLGDLSGMDANDFYKIVHRYFLENEDIFEAGVPKVSFVKITDEDIIKYNIEPSFDDLFEKFDHSGEFTDEERDEFVFSMAKLYSFNNVEFNGVEEDYSNDVAYVDSIAWFYVEGSEEEPKYYKVDERWFEKEVDDEGNIKFYFMNKPVESRERDLNEFGVPWPFLNDDESKFYFLKLPVGGKTYDIVLSRIQASKMLVREK